MFQVEAVQEARSTGHSGVPDLTEVFFAVCEVVFYYFFDLVFVGQITDLTITIILLPHFLNLRQRLLQINLRFISLLLNNIEIIPRPTTLIPPRCFG